MFVAPGIYQHSRRAAAIGNERRMNGRERAMALNAKTRDRDFGSIAASLRRAAPAFVTPNAAILLGSAPKLVLTQAGDAQVNKILIRGAPNAGGGPDVAGWIHITEII